MRPIIVCALATSFVPVVPAQRELDREPAAGSERALGEVEHVGGAAGIVLEHAAEGIRELQLGERAIARGHHGDEDHPGVDPAAEALADDGETWCLTSLRLVSQVSKRVKVRAVSAKLAPASSCIRTMRLL